MNQSLMETAREVKREIPAESKRKDSFHLPIWLAAKSNEACYELLSKAGRIEHFPACFTTHTEEVAKFFGIEKALWHNFHVQIRNVRRMYKLHNVLPVLGYSDFVRAIRERAERMGIPCKESVDAEGYHYFSTDEDPQHMVKLGNPANSHQGVQLVTMRGVILLTYYMERNPRFATPVTRNIVRLCRETGFDQVPQPEPEPIPEPAPTPETPAEPTPEPTKMDYAETLRKLFDSVLTLVEKQAEERGAEKVIQQLKEAGKL